MAPNDKIGIDEEPAANINAAAFIINPIKGTDTTTCIC